MAKIKVYICESYSKIISKKWIEVDSDMYEETKGMSEEELEEYIKENHTEMKPTTNNVETYNSLLDELYNQEISENSITDIDYWFEFKSQDECDDCEDDYDIEVDEE